MMFTRKPRPFIRPLQVHVLNLSPRQRKTQAMSDLILFVVGMVIATILFFGFIG